jgi:hypothetical protein
VTCSPLSIPDGADCLPQVKQNVQRTLAIELQKLSVRFRKQQKTYLNKLRKNNASSSSFSLLDEPGTSGRDEDFDPGFSEIQVMVVLLSAPVLPSHLLPHGLLFQQHCSGGTYS